MTKIYIAINLFKEMFKLLFRHFLKKILKNYLG